MQKYLSLLLVLFSFVILPACDRSPVLAKVGGKPIRESDLHILGEVNPRLMARLGTPEGRKRIVENYAEQALLYQEAVRRGLHRDSRTKRKLGLYKRVIISQAVLEDEMDKKINEYFNNNRDEFERAKISHILIRTVEEKKGKEKPKTKRTESAAKLIVKTIQDRLAKGEDFGKLAAELSEDTRTKASLGDLSYITLRDKRLERKGWLVLAEKAFSMKAGEVQGPIQTKDGLHIVKVTEAKKVQDIEEATTSIRFRIQTQVRKELLESLKKRYKIEYVTEKKKA